MEEETEIMLEAGVLPGVTAPTIEKILKANIITVRALATQIPKILAEQTGMGEDTAERAISKAIELIEEDFITAWELHKRKEKRHFLKTGSEELDGLLGGGIETEATTEIIGEFGAGKSQICYTLAVLAGLPIEKGGLNGKVVILDTEDTFRPERIMEIAINRELDPQKALSNILIQEAYNTLHQRILIQRLFKVIPENNVKLVIVDSMMGHLRSEYVGRGLLSARQGELAKMLKLLHKISRSTKATVVYTNQVMDNPAVLYGNPQRPIGGHVMGHAAILRLSLRKARDPKRIAKIIDSSWLPPGEAPFQISEKGIENVS